MLHRALAGALAVLLGPPLLVAQDPLPVYREPRHHLVLETGSLRVLDVRIAPGDTTLFHVHDSPFLAVRISVSPVDVQVLGAAWGGPGPKDRSHFHPGAIDADTSYALHPVTHRVTNAGTGPFHLIGITNSGPGVSPESGAPSDLPGTLELRSRWFEASRLTIRADGDSPWLSASTALVVVQPGEGRVQVQLATGSGSVLDGPAAWVYVPAGSRYRATNAGTRSATLVFVAVR